MSQLPGLGILPLTNLAPPLLELGVARGLAFDKLTPAGFAKSVQRASPAAVERMV